MKISESIFAPQDSPHVSRQRVRARAQEILDLYKNQLREWGYKVPPGYAELDEQEALPSPSPMKERG